MIDVNLKHICWRFNRFEVMIRCLKVKVPGGHQAVNWRRCLAHVEHNDAQRILRAIVVERWWFGQCDRRSREIFRCTLPPTI